MSRWRDHLAVLSGSCPGANSVKSANRVEAVPPRSSCPVANSADSASRATAAPPKRAIGTIGAFGIGVKSLKVPDSTPLELGERSLSRVDAALVSSLVDPTALPPAPCPVCGRGIWWRVSALSGGPGPWCCHRCAPPDAEDWLDGCAVPVVEN